MNLLVGGPGGSGNVILVRKNFEKLELFEMHTCLGPGAQMLFRHN